MSESIAQPTPVPVPVVVTGGWLGIPQPVWQTIIAGIVLGVLSWQQKQNSSQVANLEKIARDTHTLVNSNNGTQLKIQAATAKRLAAVTGSAVDIAESKQADSALKDHIAAQKVVDGEFDKPFKSQKDLK